MVVSTQDKAATGRKTKPNVSDKTTTDTNKCPVPPVPPLPPLLRKESSTGTGGTKRKPDIKNLSAHPKKQFTNKQIIAAKKKAQRELVGDLKDNYFNSIASIDDGFDNKVSLLQYFEYP